MSELRIPASLLLASILTVPSLSAQSKLIATFDGAAEGSVGGTYIEGGITFSGSNPGGAGSNFFGIDQATDLLPFGLTGHVEFSPPNVLHASSPLVGGAVSYGKTSVMTITPSVLCSTAKLDAFFSSDNGQVITVRAYRNGQPVGVAQSPPTFGAWGEHHPLLFTGALFDELRLYGSGSSLGGAFVVFDNVELTPLAFEFGIGCPGAGSIVPELSWSGDALAGQQVAIQVDKGLGGSTALLLFGLGQGTTPVGASGCDLLVTPIVGAPIALPLSPGGPGQGAVLLPGVLPATSTGVKFTLQAWVIDPASAAGAAATNGLDVTIG